jgi:hypothetical protein
MPEIIIVVAQTEGGLIAVANDAEATLIAGSAHQFESLELYTGTGFDTIGDIDTDKKGWVAFATPK